jgi:DNA mismatch endonuclease (patch repair protein)
MTESWASSDAARAVMRGNRGRDTRPELSVRRLVHAAGLRYRVDARPLASRRFRADMVFRSARVAVFIDGCFWHGCPEHYRSARTNAEFWSRKIEDNIARDRMVTSHLSEEGWTVIRAWEHQNPREVADAVISIVRNRPSGGCS